MGNLTLLWTLLWILVALSLAFLLWLSGSWYRAGQHWLSIRHDQQAHQAATLPPIGREWLTAQARIIWLTQQSHGHSPTAAEPERPRLEWAAAAGPAAASRFARARHGGWQRIRGLLRWPFRCLASWLGGPSVLLGLLAATGLVGGLIWNTQRQLPLPPQADQVVEGDIVGLLHQTAFQVPASLTEVRAFYRRALPDRGWRYCGTQATPQCSNLPPGGSAHAIDVYRRQGDRTTTGRTIEVWPRPGANGHTFVTVFETRPQP